MIVAVTLGITTAPGSPLQVIDVGVGPQAILHMPWSSVPTVLVPVYLINHGIIALQLRERSGKGRALGATIAR